MNLPSSGFDKVLRQEIAKKSGLSGYEDLKFVAQVKQFVPREGRYMRFVRQHSFRNKQGQLIRVKDHYENSVIINNNDGSHVFVKRNFYVPENKLGREMIFSVLVQLRIQKNGRKNIILSFKPIDISEAKYTIKYPQSGKGDIEIPGTNAKIWFKKIGPKNN